MLKRFGSSIVVILLVVTFGFLSTAGRRAEAWSKGDARAGLAVHKKSCLRCHGEQGRGDGPAAKLLKTKPGDWTNKAAMSKLTDDALLKVITGGGEAAGKSKLMPAFGDKLSAADVSNVIAFIRTLAK
jgi:mono/diheme cytochrome c family protein